MLRPGRYPCIAILSCLLALSGCASGNHTQRVAASGGDPVDGLSGSTEVLTRMEAPDNLLALARLNRPHQALKAVRALSDGQLDLIRMIEMDSHKSFAWISEVFDVEGFIDVAVLADPRPGRPFEAMTAISVGILNVQAFLETAREKQNTDIIETRPGYYQLGDSDCHVAPSLGPTSHRLVCGNDTMALARLSPYMRRGLVLRDLGPSSVVAEAYIEPYRAEIRTRILELQRELARKVGPRLSLLAVGRDLLRIAATLIEEGAALVDDADRLRWDVQLSEIKLVSDLALHMRSRSGWVAKTLHHHIQDQGMPPETFQAMPQDTLAASYQQALSQQPYKGIYRELSGLIRNAGMLLNVSADTRQHLLEIIHLWPTLYQRAASATFDSPPALLNKLARHDLNLGLPSLNPYFQYVSVIDIPATELETFLNHVIAVHQKGDIYNLLGRLDKELGGLNQDIKLRWQKVSRRQKLPTGSKRLDISIDSRLFEKGIKEQEQGKAKKPRRSDDIQVHQMWLVPEGARSWVILGPQGTAAGQLLNTANKAKTRVASMPSVQATVKKPGLAGGFLRWLYPIKLMWPTLHAFSGRGLMAPKPSKAPAIPAAIENLARAAVPYRAWIDAPGGQDVRLHISSHLDKAGLRNLGALIRQLVGYHRSIKQTKPSP